MPDICYTVIGPVTKRVSRPVNQHRKQPKKRQQGGGGASTLLDGLVAWWSLNGEANSTRTDSHTNGYDIPDSLGGVGSAAGKVASSAEFTGGSSNRLVFPSVAAAPLLHPDDSDFTIAGWINLTSVLSNSALVSTYDFTNGFVLWTPPGESDLRWRIKTTEVIVAPSTGTWFHFLAYHDSVTNQMGLALHNGAAVTAAHSTGAGASSTFFPFQLGNYFNGATSFDGYLDEIAMWSRLLTTDEKAAHYNGGDGIAYPG